MNKGDKIAEYCKGEICIHYNTIYALSTMADLKNNVVCPRIFCDRVWFRDEKKSEEVQTIDLNIDEKMILKKLQDEYKNKNIKLELYIDDDKKNEIINFFNPMNSSPTPLVWPYNYIKITKFEILQEELDLFFKTFLDQFLEKECDECKYAITNYNGMSCIDCSRNKNSVSIIKKDRYIK